MCGGGRWLRPFKADALLIITVASFSIRQAASKRGGEGGGGNLRVVQDID